MLPSSAVRETILKLMTHSWGNSCAPQESLIRLSYNVKVQEDGHTTLRAVVEARGGRPWGGGRGERQQSVHLCSARHIEEAVLEQLSNEVTRTQGEERQNSADIGP